MILSKNKISEGVQNGKIEIIPFCSENLKENSYIVTLGTHLLVYKEDILDTAKKNQTEEIEIPLQGMVLKKGSFYVGHINQYIGSDFYVPMLHGLIETAQLGLFIHVTANLIDIGNHCNFSLQIFATENVKVYPDMKIAQVSFWNVDGDKRLYNGKYKNVKGAIASKSFLHANK